MLYGQVHKLILLVFNIFFNLTQFKYFYGIKNFENSKYFCQFVILAIIRTRFGIINNARKKLLILNYAV